MKALDSAKEFLIDFFSAYSPMPRFKAKVKVRNHAISYGPKNEDPRYITNVTLLDHGLIERYGKNLEIESVDIYHNSRIGDTLVLILEINPDYDESDYKSQKLRLYTTD